jgi:hypothetical protein
VERAIRLVVGLVIAPPPPPRTQPRLDDLEALIREARARQRRRRVRIAAAIAAIAGVVAGVYFVTVGGSPSRPAASGSRGGVSTARKCPPGNLGTVAFVRGGALELLDLHGCGVRTLVSSHAVPPIQISADGRWVSFAGGYVSTGGGRVHRFHGTGTWAPHSDLLAVVTKKSGLDLVRPGGETRRLLPAGWGALTVAFSADGHTLAVSRSLFNRSTIQQPTAWHQEIWLVDIASGARRELFHLGAKELAPAWLEGFSPDGRWLLFWEDIQNSASIAADGIPLVALPVAGGEPVTITKGELHYRDFLTWCGDRLVYVIDHGGRLVTEGDGIAAASPPDWRRQTILPAGGKTSWNAVACRAGGGASLAVAAGPSSSRNMNIPWGSEHRSLWLLRPARGATPQQLVASAGASDDLPQWSADGRWLLFVRTKTHGSYIGHGSLYAYDSSPGELVGPVAPIGAAGSYYGYYGWENLLDWHR